MKLFYLGPKIADFKRNYEMHVFLYLSIHNLFDFERNLQNRKVRKFAKKNQQGVKTLENHKNAAVLSYLAVDLVVETEIFTCKYIHTNWSRKSAIFGYTY